MNSRKQKRKDRIILQKAEGGGSDYCCVPLCTASARFNKMLSFHWFPKDPVLRDQWLLKIRREGFKVTISSRVCSRHFEAGEIFVTASGKRCLHPKSIPSLFHWNDFSKKTPRPEVWERCPRPHETAAAAAEDESSEDAVGSFSGCPSIKDHDYAKSPFLVVDRNKYEHLSSAEIEKLTRQLESFQLTQRFGLQRFALSPDDIRYYTR
ncbi:hypothetical protein WMY93_001853 [Mugilogobius chulae]|uniref:THAP domain-containing protein 1 n=1 Tax=Mugilogobius chulae TaxID=88201 RepID=A0AAW0Q1R4_9GOBI